MRRFFIDKTDNMRDIGGYAIDNNRYVKEGKIIRSNCVTNLDEEELNTLVEMGFTTIIDFRSDKEIKKKRSVFNDNNKFKYYHIGLNGDGKIPDNKDGVLDSYIDILNGKEQIRKVFEILNDVQGGVIYYCSAGKDRTGVITACILKLLGVADKDIVADYIASGVFLKEELESFSKSVGNKDIFQIINPVPNNIQGLLSYVNNEYGSIDGYLKSCGILDNTLNRLKEKYIV